MNSLLKESLIFFVAIVLSNILVDIGHEEKGFLVRPFRFFGSALILSFLGGLLMHKMSTHGKEEKE